jgi:hypothetical protein
MSSIKRSSRRWPGLCGAALVMLVARAAQALTTTDNFETGYVLGHSWQEQHSYGAWLDQWNGFGTTEVVIDETRPHGDQSVLSEQPETSMKSGETHSALVTSLSTYGDMDLSVDIRTVRQLRRNGAPNPWEVGWLLWHYTDDTHFYYFILKPNGWELGKEDPAYPGNQRFLATGSSPTHAIGSWYTVQVVQTGTELTVSVNGAEIVQLSDRERPYLTGSIGLYDEDASVHFHDVSVTY